MIGAVGWLDLDAVLRATAGVPDDRVAPLVACIRRRASAAMLYRRRTGRRHPEFGDGTLAAAAAFRVTAPAVAWFADADLRRLAMVSECLSKEGLLQSRADRLSLEERTKPGSPAHVDRPHEPSTGGSGLGPDPL